MPISEKRSRVRSRNVQAYVNAELHLRRLDDQLRAKWHALKPLRRRLQRASDRSWRRWQSCSAEERAAAIAVVGAGRVTFAPEMRR